MNLEWKIRPGCYRLEMHSKIVGEINVSFPPIPMDWMQAQEAHGTEFGLLRVKWMQRNLRMTHGHLRKVTIEQAKFWVLTQVMGELEG